MVLNEIGHTNSKASSLDYFYSYIFTRAEIIVKKTLEERWNVSPHK